MSSKAGGSNYDTLAAALRRAVAASSYALGDRRIGASHIRTAFRDRKWGDRTGWSYWAAKLQVPDEAISRLAAIARPLLADYVEPEGDRVGNGLFWMHGGVGTMQMPTVPVFAEVLVDGAVKLGEGRMCELLLGWIGGEPLRFRDCAMLHGVTVGEPVGVAEGVRIETLPTSRADLPPTVPEFNVPELDLLGGVIISVECGMAPSLYRPDPEGSARRPPSGQQRQVTAAGGRIPHMTMDSFCESISLAHGEHVGWWLGWRDFGELDAFSFGTKSGAQPRPRTGYSRGSILVQEDLERALAIHVTRYGRRDKSKANLDVAIDRWVKSKRATANADALIELRIALEALYGKGAMNEKAFRVSTYGAWHLGTTPEERREVRETLKKAYDDASAAIHAGSLKHTKKDKELLPQAQAYCRTGILKRLVEPRVPDWDELIVGGKGEEPDDNLT